MKAVTGQEMETLWKELESKVDALVTRRINLFHDALVERGQIATLRMPSDPKEEASL